MEFSTFFAVAIGGGIGAVLRYLFANMGQSWTPSNFPLGTLFVNILGCALIGLTTALLIGPISQHREFLRLLLIVGVLGGFTTFSTFALDTFELFEDGRLRQALMYIILSNVFGILAAWSMYKIGSILVTTTTT
ncbi:MAG: fluoride efflux transporter CrcB [Phycisphaerae bacterium]|jgi:fluoride exporter|nr:fluoride efflux transporter CrcB [Phycisphaerae bacterium]